MVSLFLPFLFLFGGCSAIGLLARKRFEQAMPIFVLGSVFVLYCFGFFSALHYGVLLLCLVSLGGWVLFGVGLARKSTRAFTTQHIFTMGALAFICILVFVFFVSRNRYFWYWDEFSHWGSMLKETFRLNAFYNVFESASLTHRSFPPSGVLFQYLWCKITGGYNEASAYIALQFFSLSLLLPAFSRLTRKNWVSFTATLCLVLVAPLLVGPVMNLYLYIYQDAFLGILIGYCLYVAVREQKLTWFNSIELFLAVSVVSLTKENGKFAPVFLIVYFVLYSLTLLRFPKIKDSIRQHWPQHKTNILKCCIVTGATLFSIVSWGLVKAYYNAASGLMNYSSISPSLLLDAVLGRGDAINAQVARAYFMATLDRTIMNTSFFGGITYFQLFLLTLLGLFLFVYVFKKKTEDTGPFLAYSITLPISALLYHFAFLVVNVFDTAVVEEKLQVASSERYWGSFWFGAFTASFLIFSHFWGREREETPKQTLSKPKYIDLHYKKIVGILAICACLLIPFVSIFDEIQTQSEQLYTQSKPEAEKITAYLDDGKIHRVFGVFQNDWGQERVAFYHYMLPFSTNGSYYSFEPPNLYRYPHTVALSPEEWNDILINGEYEYVYLARIDEFFPDEYAELFADDSRAEKYGLYSVDTSSGKVQLRYLASMEP